jgi:hypothetical protein
MAFAFASILMADGAGRIVSKHSGSEAELSADPDSAFWRGVAGVWAENGPTGKPTPGHKTEIRSRWTEKNLYVLFVSQYDKMNPKPNPSTTTETNKLWEWDVAEVFVGADSQNIRRYREYQVSPQGEWVDLDIDRDRPLPEGGWLWNSGFHVKARIDESKKLWYGEMRIPFESINGAGGKPFTPRAGAELRINFYRLQGPKPDRAMIAWQSTGAGTYHVPEAFGRMILEK